MPKLAKVGVYGNKMRSLQRRMAYERTSLTFKLANVYRYLGSRANVTPDIKDIQLTTFLEVPDRAYDAVPVLINIEFEPMPEQIIDYSQLGVIDPIGVDQIIKVHVNSYDELGRQIIVGDVIEVPFFEQPTHRAFWEVVDVDRSQEFEKYYAVIKLNELTDSRKTREISPEGTISDILDVIQDQHEDHANDYVPFNGVDDTGIDNGEENPEIAEPFDGRRKNQASFLDDLNGVI